MSTDIDNKKLLDDIRDFGQELWKELENVAYILPVDISGYTKKVYDF